MKFNQTISLLNDLCYILEAIAQNIPGEAKTEIDSLQKRVRKDATISEKEKEEILSILSEGYSVLSTTKEERMRIAAIGIGRLSRKLWATVV